MPDDLEAELFRRLFEDIRNAFAVELAVVEDKDAFEPPAVRQLRGGSALDIVGRKGAEVVDLAGGAVNAGFARRIAGLGQARVGVRWRDLPIPALFVIGMLTLAAPLL